MPQKKENPGKVARPAEKRDRAHQVPGRERKLVARQKRALESVGGNKRLGPISWVLGKGGGEGAAVVCHLGKKYQSRRGGFRRIPRKTCGRSSKHYRSIS